MVVSGPSGAGKGTLCSALLEGCKNIQFSVSATTRNPRPGEINGVHYDFISNQRFDEMISNGEFLEYACIFGMNRYGTPKKRVETLLSEGTDVLLDIDVQGAMNVKKAMPEAVMVFVLPPSLKELENRLRKRGTEDETTLQRRLQTAKQEIKLADKYDYLIVNDDLDAAITQLRSVLMAQRCRIARSMDTITKYWEEQL